MKRVGSEGMSNKEISSICDLIINWEGKLTWQLLTSKIEMKLLFRVSRQTLCTYFAIKKEFDIRKKQTRNGNPSNRITFHNSPSDIKKLQNTIDKQNKKIESLERSLRKQSQQLQLFILNAMDNPNVDMSTLNKPRKY